MRDSSTLFRWRRAWRRGATTWLAGAARASLISLALATAPGCSPERTADPAHGVPALSAPASPALPVTIPDSADAALLVSPSGELDGGVISSRSADASAGAPEGMLFVPGGTFTMGSDTKGQADEHPAHAVTLRGFFLDRTEVTNEAYAACVAAGACRQKDVHVASHSHAGPDEGFGHPRQPVDGVSWNDGVRFCAWRGGARLPREAEFERAERGDDGRMYPWGNDKPDADRAVFARQFGHDTTDDVGSHPHGAGPYGHEDLAGNVWEWMEDEYDPIAYRRPGASSGTPGSCPDILTTLNRLRASGEQGFTGSNPIPTICEHVLRGGAFNYDGPGLRATNRVHHPGNYRLVMSGFRCAKDAP